MTLTIQPNLKSLLNTQNCKITPFCVSLVSGDLIIYKNTIMFIIIMTIIFYLSFCKFELFNYLCNKNTIMFIIIMKIIFYLSFCLYLNDALSLVSFKIY